MRLIKEKKITDADAKVDFITNLFSSFFYTGYFPKASGTVASAAALLIFLTDIFFNQYLLACLIVICFFAGIFTSKQMIKRFGDDPSVVVIDEAVGMWLTVFIFCLFPHGTIDLMNLLICFFAFRFFDITKVQPAKFFDKLNTGFGIMMDDVIAGIYAGISSHVVSYFIKIIILKQN